MRISLLTDKTQRVAHWQRCSRKSFLAAFCALFLPFSASAWNAAGHRLVASIAWDHLNSDVRTEASRLLRAHPDYERWRKRAGKNEVERNVFIEAATWPNDIIKDPRFYTAGSGPGTPRLPGFPDMDRHTSWHYVIRPFNASLSEFPASGQIDKQLKIQAKILGNSENPLYERSYALPWLIHMVGDAHQPLHVSVRLNAAGKWDKLGNGMRVNNPFNLQKPTTTLHAFWDDLPGPSGLRGVQLDAVTRVLLSTIPHPPRAISSDQWIEESWRIANESAYPQGNDALPTISSEFYENSRKIAFRRISEAGCRLGDLLNDLLRTRKVSE